MELPGLEGVLASDMIFLWYVAYRVYPYQCSAPPPHTLLLVESGDVLDLLYTVILKIDIILLKAQLYGSNFWRQKF